MRAKYLAYTLLGSTLLIAPAIAQTMSGSGSNAQSGINASATGEWQASQLINLKVYNDQNQSIGTIKELMMDKDGKIDKAVIGVGGVLGLGERDVAVNFAQLKFSDQPVPSSSNATSGAAPSTTGTGSPSAANAQSSAKKNYPDHAVLAMSKDQLTALPQFNYNK